MPSRRRTFAKVLAPGMRGRCLDTLLQLEYGEAGDPFGTSAFQVLNSWVEVITHSEAMRDRAERAWQRAVDVRRQRSPQRRWQGITGIMSAIIALLLDLSWKPLGPWHWVTDCEEPFAIDRSVLSDPTLDWSALRAEFAAALRRKLWAKASRHYCGRGLQDGADLTSVRSQLRRLRRKENFEWSGAILATVTGAMWPRARLADAPHLRRLGGIMFLKYHRTVPHSPYGGTEAGARVPPIALYRFSSFLKRGGAGTG